MVLLCFGLLALSAFRTQCQLCQIVHTFIRGGGSVQLKNTSSKGSQTA